MDRREFSRLLGITAGALTILPRDVADAKWFRSSQAEALVQSAFAGLGGEPPAKSEVRAVRGGARLFLNGDEVYPFWGTSLHLLETISNYTSAGINLIHPVLGMESGWQGPGTYDWSLIDRFLAKLLEIVPGAYFLPRLQLDTPEWWKDAHPDELISYGLPTSAEEYGIIRKENLPVLEGGHVLRAGRELREASFASSVWRADTSEMLRAFLRHVETSPLVSRMIGYHPTTGRTAEWNYFGESYLPDYNTAMEQAAGPVPSAQARMTTTFGLLRDPKKERNVIEFYKKYHDVIATTVTQICRVVKESTGRRVVCGVFYGYVTEQPRIQDGGYLAAEKVLNSPDIDYIASPYSYQPGNATDERGVRVTMVDGAGNRLGHARGVAGDGGYRLPIGSMRRRNKLFIAELDPSTYRDAMAHQVIGGHGGLGSGTVEGSLRILRRDLGGVFAHGVGGWLFDFGPLNKAPEGWYSGEPIISEMRRFMEMGALRPRLDISPAADMCAVYDQESFAATAHWMADAPWTQYGIKSTDYINHWFVNTQARAFYRTGAPLDALFRFDLTAEDLQAYRLIFMVNTFLLSSGEAERIGALLRGSGVTVVWFYAPGFITHEKLDLHQMEQLTGFRFRVLKEPAPMMIESSLDGGETTLRFGVKEKHFPRFAVLDERVRILGKWSDGQGVAFAAKRHEGHTSVYVGSAPLPAEIVRWLAETAGVKMWSSHHDIVFASRDAAMVVATSAGTRTITLPRPMKSWSGGGAEPVHTPRMETGDVEIFHAG
jgi:hypothetical protein